MEEISWDEPLPAGEPILLQTQPAHRINLSGWSSIVLLRNSTLAALWGRVFPCEPKTGSLPLETVLSSSTELS